MVKPTSRTIKAIFTALFTFLFTGAAAAATTHAGAQAELIKDTNQASSSSKRIEIPRYLGSIDTLIANYETLVEKGGWTPLSSSKTLRKGDKSAAVKSLAKHLAARQRSLDVQDLCARPVSTCHFGNEMEKLVKKFQYRHGLTVDGIVGDKTLAELNVPVSERLKQLVLNRQRIVELSEKLDNEYVIVNIPEFKLRYIADGKVRLSNRVVVGKPTWETPSFSDMIESFVINPDWRIPPSIVADSIAEKAAADPSYLENEKMVIKKDSYLDKDIVDPDSIDWEEINPGNFDYFMVRKPGKDNPLGRIKYLFPNRNAIYVHDTPAKTLFDRAKRAASHGCIRMEDPFSLALNLADKEDRENAMAVVSESQKTNETRKVVLKKPIPIHLVYWTAWVDRDGEPHFRRDIYQRDANEALNI